MGIGIEPWWAPFHGPPSCEAPRQPTIYVTNLPYETAYIKQCVVGMQSKCLGKTF